MALLSTLRARRGVLGLSAGVVALVLLLLRLRRRGRRGLGAAPSLSVMSFQRQKSAGVDGAFLRSLWRLLKMCASKNGVPLQFLAFNALLVLRSLLTVYTSGVKGKIVKAIVSSDPFGFLKHMTNLGIIAVPGSALNSYLEYLQELLALNLRRGLVQTLNGKYLTDKASYKLLSVDSRIGGPDQVLTDDVQKFAAALCELYGDFAKPLLDIALFSRKIARVASLRGPLLMVLWFALTGQLLKWVSPAFAKIVAETLRREGAFRAGHQRIKAHGEEIAFLRGDAAEKRAMNRKFASLMKLYNFENSRRFYMGILDSTLIKYGSFNVGMAILALPVFGPDKAKYLARVGADPALIMKDYEQNSTLLVGLAKAVGRVVISYKKLQQLAGATARVAELLAVLDDLLLHKRYVRQLVANRDRVALEGGGCALDRGKVWTAADYVMFEEVPIIAPNGDLLLQNLSIKIKAGKSCLIVGANGSGKTALLRVLAGLWPFFAGSITRVPDDRIMFLPQRVYLPRAALRDLLVYPHVRANKSDAELLKLLESVNLAYLHDREGGFDAVNDWYDILSGGERQRISVARLFYHQPKFAVLDEATSAVSVEIENTLYLTAKKKDITLITVTQRTTLFRFHDYVLKIKDNQEWVFEEVRHDNGH